MSASPDTPDDLKRELTDQLAWLCATFGQPRELLRFLTVAEWRRLRIWVRGLEALAARLVRALAATIAAPPRTPSPPVRKARAEPVAPDTDYPDSARWIGVRVRLRDEISRNACSRTTAERAAPDAAGIALPPNTSRGFRSARPLALRLEAVIRIAEDPLRYAKRLARRPAPPKRQTPRRVAPPAAPAPCVAQITALGPPSGPAFVETG